MVSEEVKRVVRSCIERRDVIVSSEYLAWLGVGEYVIDEVNHVVLESTDEGEVYAVLPREMSLSVEAVLMMRCSRAWEEHDTCELTRMIARYLYEKFASPFEFGDAVAWLLVKLAEDYGVEPDEVRDAVDYRHTYTGTVTLRFGRTTIVKEYRYVNYNRWYTCHGVFKGTYYSFTE